MEPRPDDAAELAELRASAGDCENEEQAREAFRTIRYRYSAGPAGYDPGTVDHDPKSLRFALHGWPGGSHHGANSTIISKLARMDRVSGLGHAWTNTTARTTPLHAHLLQFASSSDGSHYSCLQAHARPMAGHRQQPARGRMHGHRRHAAAALPRLPS